jgi:hypothetical protein
MADKEESSSIDIFGAIETGIVKYWYWILIAIIVYFIFKDNLQYAVIAAILAILAVYILGRMAWRIWVHYVQQDFISGIDFVLLEIIPPREVLRSPKAMELFFTNALYHWSEKGGREEYWQGAVWFWFSLEIASIEGQVHFYIRTPTRSRNLIETQMYAQYPQAQIKAVEDYTLAVDEISPKSKWMAWGCEWKLLKPEAFPIKTYVDFGLDKDPKEEFKVDPISPIIEFFGSLQKGEQAWTQIVVTPSKKKYHTEGTWFGHHDWAVQAKQELFNLLKDFTARKGKGEKLGTDSRIEIRVPDYLKLVVDAMNKKTIKLGFDVGMRTMYVAKKEVYTINRRKDIRLIWRQFANPDSNQLWRINSTQGDAFGSQFFGLSSEEVMLLADRMLNEFRERSFFHLPMRHHLVSGFYHKLFWPFTIIFKKIFLPYFHPETFVLNTEELATLWHFPGQILKVPTLTRIESKEASPPSNLPT